MLLSEQAWDETIKEQLSNQRGCGALGEEGKQIQQVLAGVEADDEMDARGVRGEHQATTAQGVVKQTISLMLLLD